MRARARLPRSALTYTMICSGRYGRRPTDSTAAAAAAAAAASLYAVPFRLGPSLSLRLPRRNKRARTDAPAAGLWALQRRGHAHRAVYRCAAAATD